jgi:hypothetical protein
MVPEQRGHALHEQADLYGVDPQEGSHDDSLNAFDIRILEEIPFSA